MTLPRRVAKLVKAFRGRPPAGQLTVVEAVPVGGAGGRPPGLYPAGRPGSTAGVLVYDPAAGPPVVPPGRLAPWGLVVVAEGAVADLPGGEGAWDSAGG